MDFTIKSVILWPKDVTKTIRTIDFVRDKVNIITGGSEKGKSAIIAIIDYCLGSGRCKIPTRTIRDLTAWFGILIKLKNDNELLLIRKEPGLDKFSGEMYLEEGINISIPERVEANCNFQDVKTRLNDIADLPYIDFSSESSNPGFQSRPSFRDMVSFVFQPQYIVANQSSLFYKADSAEHREKIRTIFPYILKAVDNEYLELKEELKNKERELNFLNKDLEKRKKIINRWLGEIRANFNTALELGILDAPIPEDSWLAEDYISYLRTIPQKLANNNIPMVPVGSTNRSTDRMIHLQNEEIQLAHRVQSLRNRQQQVKRLDASNRDYRQSLLHQFGRLKGTDWFNTHVEEVSNCPFCDSENSLPKDYIKKLQVANTVIIEKGIKLNDNHSVLKEELNRINDELTKYEKLLNINRHELRILQQEDDQLKGQIQTLSYIYKFVGKIESDLKNYDDQSYENELYTRISELQERIKTINSSIKQEVVENKIKRAKNLISNKIKFYAKIFKAENSEEYIDLNIKDLTLNFISDSGRLDSLYEIGSGSNYMAYHLSCLLALHEFFLEKENHPIPNLIIFDQPSQVYFPEKADTEVSEENEDIIRVRKIFEALSEALKRTNRNLQIIILEHVGQYAWAGYEDMKLVKRWREDEDDNALIPREWLK